MLREALVSEEVALVGDIDIRDGQPGFGGETINKDTIAHTSSVQQELTPDEIYA